MVLTPSLVSFSQDGLRGALLRLDLRLREAAEVFRDEVAARGTDPYRAMYVSDSEVDGLLGDLPASDVASHLLDEPIGLITPRLADLARWFVLDDFEQEALLVCFAPEVDLRYERLYAYLHDDLTRRRPTVDLILRILRPSWDDRLAFRSKLGPNSRLITSGLLGVADPAAEALPLLARPLCLDQRIVDFLLGSDQIDRRIASFARLFPAGDRSPKAGISSEFLAGLTRLLARADPDRIDGVNAAARDITDGAPGPHAPSRLIYLHGGTGSLRRSATIAACATSGVALLLVDLPELFASAKPELELVRIRREARLQQAVLAFDGFDVVLAEGPEPNSASVSLRAFLRHRDRSTVLLGSKAWEPTTWLDGAGALRVEVPSVDRAARLDPWTRQFAGSVSADQIAALATRFRLDEEAIRAVREAADLRALWRGADVASVDDVWQAAREIAAPPLEGLGRKIVPRYGWDDIVLTPDGLAQLREICARARNQLVVLDQWGFGRKHARRSGLTVLFAGQPGTGKTMAAEIVAGALGLEMYRIDLSAVVSKYIGETEKNLERIFRAADQGDAVLLFDEADALFGKRSEVKDAHDRYANVEIAYLLQRLEEYNGVAILTTNLRGNLDEAFVRRLDFALEFPMPEEAERLRIWKLALPAEAPLAPNVDLPFLARQFKLAGGHIRNIALTAAFLAAEESSAIAMKHLVRATRREYQKIGKLVASSEFDRYYDLLKDPLEPRASAPVNGTWDPSRR
ncbi:MAG TPA: ATP-binding protein [Chloroflexota bacterium]|nr:ATP-binding protein [Chloroflexota bacterium]